LHQLSSIAPPPTARCESAEIRETLAAPLEALAEFLALRARFQQSLPQGRRVGERADRFVLPVGELERVPEVA
jgi:hypothetical protein